MLCSLLHQRRATRIYTWLNSCRQPVAAAGAKTVRVWSLGAGFPCVATLQVADLRGSLKSITAVGGSTPTLYVGGQSCQVTAYRLSQAQLAADAAVAATPPAVLTALEGALGRCSSAAVARLEAHVLSAGAAGITPCGPCPPPTNETIRAVVGQASPPVAASAPAHSHCGSITSLAVCGPYVISGSSDSTVRVWRAGTLEFVKCLRGHRGSVLALYGGPGIVLRCGGWGLVAWIRNCSVCPS